MVGKRQLKQFGIKLIALTLLVIMLVMYPVQSLAFENFFKQQFDKNKEDEGIEGLDLEWGNLFLSAGPIKSKFNKQDSSAMSFDVMSGTPILAPSSGAVVKSDWSETSGYFLEVLRTDGLRWRITNFMTKPLPQIGQRVIIGQEIGYVGSSSELYFEIFEEDKAIDPETIVDFNAPGVSRGIYFSGTRNSLLLDDFKKSIQDGDFFYKGVPEGHFTRSTFNFWKWIVNFLFEIVDYLLGLVASVFNLGVLGWVILVEVFLTDAFDSLVVKNSGSGTYRKNNIGFYTDSKRTVNIENILFNRVELFNVNFFESKESVKKRMLKYSPTGLEVEELYGDRLEEELEELEDGPLLMIKDFFFLILLVLYGLGLLLLLMALIVNAIMAAFESSVLKKATYKKRAMSWLKAVVEMFLLLVYMIFLLQVHTWAIDFLSRFADIATEQLSGGYIQTDMGRNYTIMETLRTRAYSLKLTVGVPATIMYTVLIWYTLKFVLMYTKRFLIVFLLSILGPLLMVYDLIIKTIKGQSSVRIDWIKEYTFNVLIQVVHAFVYLVFVPLTLSLASASIAGFIVMFILLKFLLEADKLIRQIFNIKGAKKHSTLDNILEKSTAQDFLSGFAIREIIGKDSLTVKAAKKITAPVLKPIKAVVGTAASAAFRGSYNLTTNIQERRRRKRLATTGSAKTESQLKREKIKNQRVEDILRLQGYTDKEIEERLTPGGKLSFTEEQKDQIRLLESSRVIKTGALIRGVNKVKFTSNRFKRVLKDMGEEDSEGRRVIKGRTFSYDYDSGKIKLSDGVRDKFKKSVIKEFKMGDGKKGEEQYQKTIDDFKKAGVIGLKAFGTIMFFPLTFADSSVPDGLYLGLRTGNFQFNNKILHRQKVSPGIKPTSSNEMHTKRQAKKQYKTYKKTNRELYRQEIDRRKASNVPLKRPKKGNRNSS